MVILVVGRRDVPALGEAAVILGVARPVGAAADLAFAVADLDEVDDGVTRGRIAGVAVEGAEGGARVVELGDDGRFFDVLGLHALGNGIAVDIEAAVGVDHQVIVQVHTGVIRLVVQGGVVTRDGAVGIEGVGVARAAGPGHLVAVGGNEIIAQGVILRRGLLGLFPLGDVAALGEAGQVIVAGGGGGVLGVEIVGVVGDDEEVHVLGGVHGVLIGLLQRAGAVGILGGMGVDLAEVQAHAALADEERPAHVGGLAVGALDGNGDGVAALVQGFHRLIGDLGVGDGRRDGLLVKGHGDGRVGAAVGDIDGDLRALLRAGGGVGQRGDGEDERLILDCHGLLVAVDHAVSVGRRALERQGGFTRQLRAGNHISIGVAVDRRRHERLCLTIVEGVGHGHIRDSGDLVEGGGKRIVHADVGILARDVHLRVEDVAEAVGIFDDGELHGEDVAALIGVATEGIAEILDADSAALVLRGFVIDNVTAGALLERPFGVVVLFGVEVEAFGVFLTLVLGGTQILAVILEGVVGAVKMDGEDQRAVAPVGTVIRRAVFDGVKAGRGLVIGLRTEGSVARLVVDNDLLTVGGLFARDGLGADVAVAVGVGRGIDCIELHREDGLVRRVKAPRAERAAVDLDAGGLTAAEIVGVGDLIAVTELFDRPLRALFGAVSELRGAGGRCGVVFAAADEVVAAGRLFKIVHTGARRDLQRCVLLVGRDGIAGRLAAGRFRAHGHASRRRVDHERRSGFGDRVERGDGVFFRRCQRSHGQHCENHHHDDQRGEKSLELLSHCFSSLFFSRMLCRRRTDSHLRAEIPIVILQ